jgi:hypothetical protein
MQRVQARLESDAATEDDQLLWHCRHSMTGRAAAIRKIMMAAVARHGEAPQQEQWVAIV